MLVSRKRRSFAYLLLVVLYVLIIPVNALAYVGPGAGFAVAGSFLVMFTAVFSAFIILLTWPIRYLIRLIRGRNTFAKARVKRVVILGLDGMDYALTRKMLDEGKLPNFAELRRKGCFKALATTIPPISPVAWSSFQTGSNPGKHNVFDFLTINRNTYQPKLSSVEIRESGRKINLGKYQFALGKTNVRSLRKGRSFWNVLGEHGIFSNIIRVPITFPPEKFHGLMLSAMCVPDLRGSQGTFSFYTTDNSAEIEHTGGERYHVSAQNNCIKSHLVGPENPFRKDVSILRCPFVVTLNGKDSQVGIAISGRQFQLEKNKYSDWVPVVFDAAPGIKICGICKFLLLRVQPDFELYVTPVNIDPEKPVMPIAHPSIYSTYLTKRQGPFATLGLAEDTWALNEGILDDNAFIEQSVDIDTEREKMFFDALDKLKRGLCVCVFDGTDRIQHTFWREIDQQHPAHRTKQSSAECNAVEQVYKRMDVMVGKTLSECNDKNTLIMIISDHGFNTFRYGVDLNRWLEENGYLKVKPEGRGKKHLAAVDWSETRAFAIGLAGIFLNIKNRYAHGIVEPGEEAERLQNEIARKLTGLTDSLRQQRAIKQIYKACDVYKGPYSNESPDLIVGYDKGYRASWQMAVGHITENVFHENTKAWSGDHCIDHELVPGVLFCNRPIETEKPRLMDIGPTVLDMFGIRTPGYMDGSILSVADTECDVAKNPSKESAQDSSGDRNEVI